MNHFFGTFLSGAGEIVGEMLRRRLPDAVILSSVDGAVEFTTAVPYSDLNLFCFHNVFQVLYKSEEHTGDAALDGFLRGLLSAPADWAAAGQNSSKIRSFRLVTSKENKLTAVDSTLRGRLEKKLMGVTGLRVDRSSPDTEFWLLSRREGTCWFLKRLSRHTAYDKLLDPGELHPELAYMMCWLTEPKHTDTVLDPFCGYGAIPLQRSKRFPFEKLLCFDISPKPLARTREKLPHRENIAVKQADALRLSALLPAQSVSAVITDPPWGLYEDVSMPIETFYSRFLTEMEQVMAPGGRLVLLTAAKEEFARAAAAHPAFVPQREFHILVSGKKCGLYLLYFHPGEEVLQNL